MTQTHVYMCARPCLTTVWPKQKKGSNVVACGIAVRGSRGLTIWPQAESWLFLSSRIPTWGAHNLLDAPDYTQPRLLQGLQFYSRHPLNFALHTSPPDQSIESLPFSSELSGSSFFSFGVSLCTVYLSADFSAFKDLLRVPSDYYVFFFFNIWVFGLGWVQDSRTSSIHPYNHIPFLCKGSLPRKQVWK